VYHCFFLMRRGLRLAYCTACGRRQLWRDEARLVCPLRRAGIVRRGTDRKANEWGPAGELLLRWLLTLAHNLLKLHTLRDAMWAQEGAQ